MSHKETGDWGEEFVRDHVSCPNCGKPLQLLPPSYPLFDAQCSACLFRAQVKASKKRPGPRIRGAGWSVMDAVLKTGSPVPPMLAVYAWEADATTRRQVRFYPFIPRSHLKSRSLSTNPDHPRASYRMFEYERMDTLPHFTLLDE